MSDPNLIDPEIFAAERQNLQGSFLLEELDERVSLHDYPADRRTKISFTLTGGRDRLQRVPRPERQSRYAPDLPEMYQTHAVHAR